MNIKTSIKPKPLSLQAREYMVWRAGESVQWECTARELSAELGYSYAQIKEICNRKGWKIERDTRNDLGGRASVLHLMAGGMLGHD